MRIGMIPLLAALILSSVGIVLWGLRLETTAQLFWWLGIVVFLWCAAQASFYLRPRRRQEERIRAKSKSLIERFFPGASLVSGIYNRESEKVWDGNESLPPSHVD